MYHIIAWLFLIWFFILFCDTIFKTCMFHPYYKALRLTGLDVKPLSIRCSITRFNRYINQMGHWKPSFLKSWFNSGALATCLLIIPTFLLFVYTLIQMFYTSTIEQYNNLVLMPLIPGINLPLSSWMLYCFTILICSVIHEFGHALAASREGISMENCGFALYLFVPLAFVNLNYDQFKTISKWQQLRILCAGIWHNIVIALGAILTLFFFTTIISPFFTIGNGVSVMHIHKESALNNPAGFSVQDNIIEIGKCSITNASTWNKCLDELHEKPLGMCVPFNVETEDSNSVNIQKCSADLSRLFFQTRELEPVRGICLYARTAVQEYSVCDKTFTCEKSSLCMFPYLSPPDELVVLGRQDKPAVLYVGSVTELRRDVSVSEYLPRFKIFPSSIAENIRVFFEYIFMFSSGLACLNMLPIFALDGEYIIENLIHISLSNVITMYKQRNNLFKYICRASYFIIINMMVMTVHKMYSLYFSS